MAISDWPVTERPHEKLLTLGAQALSNAELLAILLRTGVKGQTALDLARSLLAHYGNLRDLFKAKPYQFCQFSGLGPIKYTQLQASLELAKRQQKELLLRQNILSNPNDLIKYLSHQLRDYEHEVFACLFLDSKYHLISFQELFHGTINESNVYPREIIKNALLYNATFVIFAHNHPSGYPTPSIADRELTLYLIKALELVQIKVIDHIIIGDGCYVSFAENGLLPED